MYCSIYIILALGFARVASGQTTTVSQNGCSYTFLVPKQYENSCPISSNRNESNTEYVDYLKSIIRTEQDQLTTLAQNIFHLQEKMRALKTDQQKSEIEKNETITIGTNYIRWGRMTCPDTAVLLYDGYAAKSHYTHTGGGADYICLDKNPEWPDGVTASFQSNGYIYGVEYQTLTGFDGSLVDNDAPCAVCHVEGRGEKLMIPGRRTCPESWTKEYEGLLVSDYYKHQKATYVCLDKNPDILSGGGGDANGGLFYTIEAACGALPCPPYGAGYEIACVVCTH